jgi:3-(3-hydroxy-phenyl)propionate hydroxylase
MTTRFRSDYDLIIVGAGPVGLTLANFIGAAGLQVLIVEQLEALIDYPRGVGMDDECLRVFQAIGLADKVVQHTTPHQWMEFKTAAGKTLALIRPQTEIYGWPKRNAFIQPLADAILFEGVQRFPNVTVSFGTHFESFEQDEAGIRVALTLADGSSCSVAGRYLIGCDGGRSAVRKGAGIEFRGETESTKWLVVDIEKDPIGLPNSVLICDPARPYVSIALPHGVRRLEFMVMPGEAEEELTSNAGMQRLLARTMPDPAAAHIIRSRVYTHHARIADTFRQGRIFIAGDAAHLMPVWQGQGYNTGIRDANNLAWKLIEVLKGRSDDKLLDSYTSERRDHASAIIQISTMAGRIFSPTNKLLAATRNVLFAIMKRIPPIRDYIVQMRFKPMPRYTQGVVVAARPGIPDKAVGRLFVQPKIRHGAGAISRLDDVIGNRFALVAWAANPWIYMSENARAFWQRLDAKILVVRPDTEFALSQNTIGEGAELVGDVTLALKDWFAENDAPVLVLRPDRFVAAACAPQDISATLDALAEALHARARKAN